MWGENVEGISEASSSCIKDTIFVTENTNDINVGIA
jgi:hypothetical protein